MVAENGHVMSKITFAMIPPATNSSALGLRTTSVEALAPALWHDGQNIAELRNINDQPLLMRRCDGLGAANDGEPLLTISPCAS